MSRRFGSKPPNAAIVCDELPDRTPIDSGNSGFDRAAVPAASEDELMQAQLSLDQWFPPGEFSR